MKIQDALNETLEKTPSLELVAFGDLSTGLILNSASRAACPREVLDLIAERAAAGFSQLNAAALPTGSNAEAYGTTVIYFTERNAEIFARHPEAAEDVVCAVCRPGTPLLPALRAGLRLAYRIADTT